MTAQERAREVAAAVPDPELPMLSIGDLGVLRDVSVHDNGSVLVTVTPTYSGCPAMDAIRADLRASLAQAGFDRVEVRTVLAPAWTTDWISSSGRAALAAAGIAPPAEGSAVTVTLSVRCPHCGSGRTEELSRFGATACRALWRCRDCAEPFDHLKVH